MRPGYSVSKYVFRLLAISLSLSWSSLSLGADAGSDGGGAQHEHEESPCNVAVCFSGHVRSFVYPMVHRSIEQNLIDVLKAQGCQVDVFAYVTLEDTVSKVKQVVNSEFTPKVRDVEEALAVLTPREVMWHQEQAGIIPNPCHDDPPGHSASLHDANDGPTQDWWRDFSTEASPNLYWQLYKSLAAYRMALRQEHWSGDRYDWIIRARFDVAWIRPFPKLRMFSQDAVWFGMHYWPMADHFALVPRAFAERFFLAIAAYYECDGESWPPPASWWQPACGGMAFEESVLFRHLHKELIPYHFYPHFEYAIARGTRGGKCDLGSSTYITACNLLSMANMFRFAPQEGDECIAALSEWWGLRCRALLSAEGINDPSRTSALSGNDLSSWEKLARFSGTAPTSAASPEDAGQEKRSARTSEAVTPENSNLTQTPLRRELEAGRARLIALRDAIADPQDPEPGAEEADFRARFPRKGRWDAWSARPPVWVYSPHGCPITELGICTADGTSGLSWMQHVDSFLRDPTSHCVGYERLSQALGKGASISTLNDDTSETGRIAPRQERATSGQPHHWNAPELTQATAVSPATDLEHSREASPGSMAADVVRGAAPPPPQGGGADVNSRNQVASPAEIKRWGHEELTPLCQTSHGGQRKSSLCSRTETVDIQRESGVKDGDPGKMNHTGGSIDTTTKGDGDREVAVTSSTGAESCPPLLVQAMNLLHPQPSMVYWEGPVEVQLVVNFTGPGVQGLDLNGVHACAETEESWPIHDWSRTCVPLSEMASPSPSPLVFGSAIGVVTGTVSLWDARPGCALPSTLTRWSPLTMVGAGGPGQAEASRRVRFKVIHHRSMLARRGRPLGPPPLGRGLATVEAFLSELEREADHEAGSALKTLELVNNHTFGSNIHLKGTRCGSRLDIHDRSTALTSSGFQLQFIVEQLEWMLENGKLPAEMRVAVSRVKEVQAIFPGDPSSPEFHKPQLLDRGWRKLAPFFQKALRLPAPDPRKVVTAQPLTTREYDEVLWMTALNPSVDWRAVEEAYLGNKPVEITYVDNFLTEQALSVLLDMARGSSIFVDNRENYIGAYPSDGMSHPLIYQIAEEVAERLPRIVGRGTSGWPLVQAWIYVYGGNDGERCTRGIRVHADTAMVNLNVWLAPDSANLGRAEDGDGGGLTIFHAKPPENWQFRDFNRDPDAALKFVNDHEAGNTSVPYRQNRALLFNSMLFHQSDPFRFKKGFENRRINLTLLFGAQPKPGDRAYHEARALEHAPDVWYTTPQARREVSPREAGTLRYCL